MNELKRISYEIAAHALRPVQSCATGEQYQDAHGRITTALDNFRKSPAMHQVALSLWQAWMELNAIRARDGVPRDFNGRTTGVDEDYFSRVVDDCASTYEMVTGRKINPWAPLPNDFVD